MDLVLEKIVKISNVLALKNEIEHKRKHIKQEQEELKMLEEAYNKEQKSSLPILLFVIDETLPMPDDIRDYNYEYVYYCPDLDDIKCIVEHKSEKLLPNAIDLRESFIDMGVPNKVFPGGAWNYGNEIKEAVSILKNEINSFMLSNIDSSWNELGTFLVDKFNEKGSAKMLKLGQMIGKDFAEDE